MESTLRIQILNLEKNNVSASETQANTLKLEEGNSSLTDTKETLRAIYKQVETQKKLFLDLKAHSIKIERDADILLREELAEKRSQGGEWKIARVNGVAKVVPRINPNTTPKAAAAEA